MGIGAVTRTVDGARYAALVDVAHIGHSSRVLHISCGADELASWIARCTGASVQRAPTGVRQFADRQFTHVITQGPDAYGCSLPEIARILEPRGVWVSDE